MEQMRLNKYLAHCGVCSRRDADKLIERGEVLVNGTQATYVRLVGDGDEVLVSGRRVQAGQERVVLAFYKPLGVTCTERDAHAERIVSDLIDYPVRVTYAGRLDKDSHGLILMTNQGDLVNKMMRGGNLHEKEYIVRVNREVTESFLRQMAQGVYLEELGVTTRPCHVEKVGKYTFRIILTQGLNRQIRRMCQVFQYRVIDLKRVRIMNICLGSLKEGAYREVTEEEWGELLEQIRSSSNQPVIPKW